ncbi:hypothetical protein GEU84_020230 [Fertoebacter nigrum]|uniref:Uncharacterized protein n=1 Tax=Fertoeibacter niger TaxID=2656921 RepID=A0A8X8H5F7_9RHOB|nr:hypothetical protein [Fertoeibacter niger]NUB46724.1 hypothetical protein [Fertoeibacter niger]
MILRTTVFSLAIALNPLVASARMSLAQFAEVGRQALNYGREGAAIVGDLSAAMNVFDDAFVDTKGSTQKSLQESAQALREIKSTLSEIEAQLEDVQAALVMIDERFDMLPQQAFSIEVASILRQLESLARLHPDLGEQSLSESDTDSHRVQLPQIRERIILAASSIIPIAQRSAALAPSFLLSISALDQSKRLMVAVSETLNSSQGVEDSFSRQVDTLLIDVSEFLESATSEGGVLSATLARHIQLYDEQLQHILDKDPLYRRLYEGGSGFCVETRHLSGQRPNREAVYIEDRLVTIPDRETGGVGQARRVTGYYYFANGVAKPELGFTLVGSEQFPIFTGVSSVAVDNVTPTSFAISSCDVLLNDRVPEDWLMTRAEILNTELEALGPYALSVIASHANIAIADRLSGSIGS